MNTAATNQIPYLSDEDIERSALSLLKDFSDKRDWRFAAPIPVEDILEKHLKLGLEFDDLHAELGIPRPQAASDPEVLGALYLNERRVVIDTSLDPDVDGYREGRYRYTLAHEGAHWVLHRDLLARDPAQGGLFDGAETPNVICRSSQKKERIEIQADLFASCLLMPRKLVFQAWDHEFPDRRPRVLKPERPVQHPFVEVPLFGRDLGRGMSEGEDNALLRVARPFAERFCVSPLAMRIRLEKLGLLHRAPPLQRVLRARV